MFEYGQEWREGLFAGSGQTYQRRSGSQANDNSPHTHTQTRSDWIELIFFFSLFCFLREEVGRDKYSGGEKRKSRPIVDSIDRE